MFIRQTVTLLALLHTVAMGNIQPAGKFHYQRRSHSAQSLNSIAESKYVNANSLNKDLPNHFSSSLFKRLNLNTTPFSLNGAFENLTIQFGADSTIWLLVDYKDSQPSKKNKIFRSADYGSTYQIVTTFDDCLEIDEVFVNPYKREHVIFSDRKNKVLFVSEDNGKDWKDLNINFEADKFFFTAESSVILSFDQSKRQLWITIDGEKWNLIGESIVQFSETIISKNQQQYIYYMEKPANQVSAHLVRFDLKAFKDDKYNQNVQEARHVLRKDLVDFFTIGNSVFIVNGPDSTGSLYLMASVSAVSDQFSPVVFDTKYTQIIGFQLVQLKGADKFIVVSYRMNNIVFNDLFKSNGNTGTKFKLSLKNIINRCQPSSENANFGHDSSCIEMQALNEKGHVYIANAQNEHGVIEAFIKSNPKSDKWKKSEVNNPDKLALNLDTSFVQIHKEPESSFSLANLPDVMFARVNKKNEHVGVYAIQDEGNYWTKILSETFIFSVGFDEEEKMTIIVAAESNKPTNKLIYSFDGGYSWNEWYFSNGFVLVDEIVRDPLAPTNSFFLVCTGLNSTNSIIKLDFSSKSPVYVEEEPNPILDPEETLPSPIGKQKHSHCQAEKLPSEIKADKLTESHDNYTYILYLIIYSEYLIPIFIFVISFLIALLLWINKKSIKVVSKSSSAKLLDSYKSAGSKPIFRVSDKERLIRIEEGFDEDMLV